MITGKIQKPSLIRDTLLGWGNLIFAEVLCLMINLFTAGLMNNSASSNIWRGVIGFCTMGILVCIMVNYAYNNAKKDKAGERAFGIEHSKSKYIFASALISLPLILEWLLLLIFKISDVSFGDTFYVIYRMINIYFLPWINIFCLEPNLDNLSYMALITIFAFTLIPCLTYGLSYTITYHNIDVEKILMYNRD